MVTTKIYHNTLEHLMAISDIDTSCKYILIPVNRETIDGAEIITPDESYELYGHIVYYNSSSSILYDSNKDSDTWIDEGYALNDFEYSDELYDCNYRSIDKFIKINNNAVSINRDICKNSHLSIATFKELENIIRSQDPTINLNTNSVPGIKFIKNSNKQYGAFYFTQFESGDSQEYYIDPSISSEIVTDKNTVINYFIIKNNSQKTKSININHQAGQGTHTYETVIQENTPYSIFWFSKQYLDKKNTNTTSVYNNYDTTNTNNINIYINFYVVIDDSKPIYQIESPTNKLITFNKITKDSSLYWTDNLKYNVYNNVVTITKIETTHHLPINDPNYEYSDASTEIEATYTIDEFNKQLRAFEVKNVRTEDDSSINQYDYIINGARLNNGTVIAPASTGSWVEIKSDVNTSGDSSRVLEIYHEYSDIEYLTIYTKDKCMDSSFDSCNENLTRIYVNSNGYSINISKDDFKNIHEPGLEINDYIKVNNGEDNNLIKINQIYYNEPTEEYKLLLSEKIYHFTPEEYNETYISKSVTAGVHKLCSENANIDVIKTNLQCIFVNCLLHMENFASGDDNIIQNNIKKFFAAQFVHYCWILIQLIYNIKNIVDDNYLENYNNSIQISQNYICKYLALTDPYALYYSKELLNAYVSGVNQYFYKSSNNSVNSLLKEDINDVLYSDSLISVYDKLLTISSAKALKKIKKLNWASRGEVHVNDRVGSTAMYAVTTYKNPNEIKRETLYNKQFDESDYSSVKIKDSVYIGDANKQNKIVLHPDEEIMKNTHYYIKQGNISNLGYTEVTTETPANAVTSIKDLLSASYIKPYIKPTWISSIRMGLIDKDIIKKSVLDDSYDYMYITFNSNIFKTTFKVGEKVKIIFESAENKEYIGQSTYEVVGYDLVNNAVIIKGYINEEYLNQKQHEVWGRLYTYKNPNGTYTILSQVNPYVVDPNKCIQIKNEKNDIMYFVKTNKVITINDSFYSLNDMEIFAYDTNGVPLRNNGDLVTNKLNISIPIKYEYVNNENDSNITNENINSDELNDGSNVNDNEEIIWYYRMYSIIPSAENILPVIISADTSEKINMYISYAHHSYVDYPMKVVNAVENIDGTTEVEIEYNRHTRRMFDFIDDTFSISTREFDINEGISGWMNSKRNSIHLNDSTGNIFKNDIYKYSNISPALTKDNNLIAFDVDLTDTCIDSSSYLNSWKVYKHSNESNKEELMFESFNPILYLDFNDKGTYSIESFVSDRYGNTASKFYKGVYKIK